MKQLAILSGILLFVSQLCVAAACGNGTLASYIALGPGGCTIGGDTLFDFQTVAGQAGATGIADGSVQISAFGGTLNPGLTASITKTARAGALLEVIFTYQISGALFTGDSIDLAKSSATGDQGVTDIQNYCAGGTFDSSGVSGCSGTAGTLLAALARGLTQTSDGSPLGPSNLLSVTDDFTLGGGSTGFASAGTITDQFTAVPEPASFWFLSIGVVLVGVRSRLEFKK